MGVKYTAEQQQVIDLRNRNILVSAAAGSGKTAVLVERIIARLTKDEAPIDVDRLLIVTYTEAAAAEMKERIRNAIEKALEENPEDAHLQRQSTLIHHAQVTTIHSFCLSVIREYFHTIDLDPGFRIGEEGELQLLKRDVLEELLETCYQEGTQEFYEFIECFASGRDDKKIEEIILQLYDYSRSYPNPDAWLAECAKRYDVSDVEGLNETSFVVAIMEEVKRLLKDVEDSILFAKEICTEEDGPIAYAGTLDGDLCLVQSLQEAEKYTEMEAKLSCLKWERLATNRDKTVSEEKIEVVKNIRDEYKKIVGTICEDYFYDFSEELQQELANSKTNMQVLAHLVQAFAKAYSEKKQNKNLIDFNDMEHYALKILTREERGKLIPSPVAEEYQEKFLEVMIDEYQDSNLVQEAILTSVSSVSKGVYNVFMVGDVKQSIYRFRLSRPELFMQKYSMYSSEESVEQKIDLHKNFRSRREVLDGTNFVFEQIMTDKLGGIAYDENAALYVGANYEEYPGNETEVCFIDASELYPDENVRELEARTVAGRIKRLVGNHMVFDKKENQYRKARYSDVVILVRSLKGWADTFLQVMAREGVPAYSGSKEGYFETREIRMLLDYLRSLDNPRQDIPFTALLRSAFLGVSNEELALIKNYGHGKTFYEKTCAYAQDGECSQLRERLAQFLTAFDKIRHKVPYTSIHALLWEIMDETGYANYVAALPAGEQRMANLEMLVEKAIAFEATSYKGLFHFVRYIEQLHKYNVDYGEASIVEETTDVVRVMSIHKSKGLEFPIVFVVGMDKLFNMQDARASIVIHPELGVGLDAIDVDMRTKTPTLLKRMIQKEIQKESVAEELRVLYVAMTRAKEKLILTGTVKNMEQVLKQCAALSKRDKIQLSYTRLVKAKKYFDWVIPALYRNHVMADVMDEFGMEVPFQNPMFSREVPIRVSWLKQGRYMVERMEETFREEVTKQILTEWDVEAVYDACVKEQLKEQLSFLYPYEAEGKIKPKMTVSELKKRAYMEEEEIEEEVVIPLLPKFLQAETEVSGAARGTAFHRVMELLDFTKEYQTDTLKTAIDEMVGREMLTKDMAESVPVEDVLRFLQSTIGQRMQEASKKGVLHREQPFVLGDSSLCSDVTLVQGIIDVYFEEDDEWVILDYKTDRVWNETQLQERYKVQLDYYGKALEQMTNKRVKSKMIYSFTMHREIEV